MKDVAKLLSLPTNFAIVQLPGRRYPGVVFQGDTLSNLLSQIERIESLLKARDMDELEKQISDVREVLSAALLHYKSVINSEKR